MDGPNELRKTTQTLAGRLADAIAEGQESIRVLDLSGEEVAKVLEMDATEIEKFLRERKVSFSDHYLRIKTPRATSEGYMKSPEDLQRWLRRVSHN